MTYLRIFGLVILLLLSACQASESSVTPSLAPSPSPSRILVFVVEDDAPDAESTGDIQGNIDTENQRIMDTAFDNLFSEDSIHYEMRLAIIFDYGPQHVELSLDGYGNFRGMSARSNVLQMDSHLEGSSVIDGILYEVIADVVFDGSRLYFKVFVANDNALGETRQTPWLYQDLQAGLENVFGGTALGQAGTPAPAGNLPSPEDFFGNWNFDSYIQTRRLSDNGNVARFRRNVDLYGISGSEALLNLMQLSNDFSTQPIMSATEIAAMSTELPRMFAALFPRFDVEMEQHINLSNQRLNQLSFEVNLELDESALTGVAGNSHSLDLRLDLSFSQHGEDLAIMIPTDAIPLESYQVVPLPTPGR